MKKIVLILLITLLIGIPALAAINKSSTEVQAINILSALLNKLDNDSVSYVSIRQKIEDKLANFAVNLDVVDQTKLNQLSAEIQDIVDAIDDLRTKIITVYPETQ